MEPVSLIALGAAIGGASGKFVEKAWDSGEKWIRSYFKDHKENAQKQATENSKDFLNELAQRVKQLEDQKTVSKEKIDQAQDHPDFSAFLQKALLTSAQTDSKDKHKLLARLVSERLTSEPESVFSLASKMACDALSFASIPNYVARTCYKSIWNQTTPVSTCRIETRTVSRLDGQLDNSKTFSIQKIDNWKTRFESFRILVLLENKPICWT